MFDAHIQFARRYAFYFDREGNIHPIDACRLDRLQASKPDATLPEMAGQTVRFALFYVERFTSPPRIVVSDFPLLPLDADGHIDQQRLYDALQCEVDQLEANDYAAPTPTRADTLANLDEAFGALAESAELATLADPTDIDNDSIATGFTDPTERTASTRLHEPAANFSNPTNPADSSPAHTPSSTHWTPDPATYRRLVAALRQLRRPSWLTQQTSRTAA